MVISKKNDIEGLIIDMDGVLWRQDETIIDIKHVFEKIRSYGCKVTLETNNASLSIDQYVEKLKRFGVSLQKKEIINSSQTAAFMLKNKFPQGGPVYIVGEKGLEDTLKEYGFYFRDKDVIAVVVGMDRNLTFSKLCEATLLIRSGSFFVGTNSDPTFPTPRGLIPGVGSILKALEVASGQKPIIVGKPKPEMYQLAMRIMQTKPENTLVIGDRLETDILGAQRLGCMTALVLSGVSTLDDVKIWNPKPDWILNDLRTVIDTLEKTERFRSVSN